MSKEETQILAKLRKRSKSNYKKVKEVEAKAGGKVLPLGLENGIAQITGTKLGEDKNERAYIYLYSSVIEPESHKGVANGFYFPLEEDNYNTEEENQSKFTVALKLLGYEEVVNSHDDLFTLISDIGERIEQDKPVYYFNTGRKVRTNGDVTCFIQSLVEEGYTVPEKTVKNEQPETHKPATKKAVKAKAGSLSEGEEVETTGDYFGDGNVYKGIILAIDGDTASVQFEDGDVQDVPSENLAAVKKAAPTKGAKKAPVKKAPVKGIQQPVYDEGDAITSTGDFFGNGEDYDGTIQSVDGDTASVEWEDGEVGEVPLKNIKPKE